MLKGKDIRWSKPLSHPVPGHKLLAICFAHQRHPVQDRFFGSPCAQRDLLCCITFRPQIKHHTFMLGGEVIPHF